MKKVLETGLILTFLSVFMPVFANVRAPYYQDNHFSGSATTPAADAAIVLAGETMNVSYPVLEEGNLDLTADFEIVYRFSNVTASPVTTAGDFLGINTGYPRVELNGAVLQVTAKQNPAFAKEFIVKISEHRLVWNTANYRHYLDRAQYVFQYLDDQGYWDPNTNWLAELKKMVPGDARLHELFFENYAQWRTNDFSDYGFSMTLRPGLNELRVKYSQVLAINERTSGYGPVRVLNSVIGFDYLLYPALSWKLADGFLFEVEVSVPDFRKRGLFFTRYFQPKITTNLEFEDFYDARSRIHRYRGEYRGYPADVFTFLAEVKR